MDLTRPRDPPPRQNSVNLEAHKMTKSALPPPPRGTIPVRVGLEVDLESLKGYLVGKVPGILPEFNLEARQFNHGQSNPTYLLTQRQRCEGFKFRPRDGGGGREIK
eukprot:812148-Amorphochlora_amoeboformis.AAC.3